MGIIFLLENAVVNVTDTGDAVVDTALANDVVFCFVTQSLFITKQLLLIV